jgi:DNA-binding response OmpR family regulator
MSRPALLVADRDPRSRLRLVSALRDDWQVGTPAPGEELVRLCRKERPAVVLLRVGRGPLQDTLRTCRVLKTEAGRTPLVGLVDPARRLRDPAQALEGCAGDGYLGGAVDDDAVRAFVTALANGERPIVQGPGRGGLLDRILRR